MCFTENDVDGGNPVFSISLTTTSDNVTLRDLLSEKLYETRSEVPFNEWSEEWKDKYPGKLFYFFSLFSFPLKVRRVGDPYGVSDFLALREKSYRVS